MLIARAAHCSQNPNLRIQIYMLYGAGIFTNIYPISTQGYLSKHKGITNHNSPPIMSCPIVSFEEILGFSPQRIRRDFLITFKWDHSSCNYLVILNNIYIYYNLYYLYIYIYIYHENPLITVKGYKMQQKQSGHLPSHPNPSCMMPISRCSSCKVSGSFFGTLNGRRGRETRDVRLHIDAILIWS